MNWGQTVLAVPVPALDEVVRERTAFYDASFLQWWANHDCRRLRSWPLGQAG